MAGDIVSCSSRPEWLPLLHHVAMLHATVRLRRSTYPQAWAKEYPWKHTQLMVCFVQSHVVMQCYTMLHKWCHLLPQDTLHCMMRELQSTEVVQPGIGGVKPIAWSGIRHMISEVSLICLSVRLLTCLSISASLEAAGLQFRLDKRFMLVAMIIGQYGAMTEQ